MAEVLKYTVYSFAAYGAWMLVNSIIIFLLRYFDKRRFPLRPGGVVVITGE